MDHDKSIEIGRRIAALRSARGWSQGWLSSQAGMTQSVLSRVESGKREARARELAELARALGVGPETLLEGGEADLVDVEPAPPPAVLAPASAQSLAALACADEAPYAAFHESLDLADAAPLETSLVDDRDAPTSALHHLRADGRPGREHELWRRSRESRIDAHRTGVQESQIADEAGFDLVRASRREASPLREARLSGRPGADQRARATTAHVPAVPAPVAQVVEDYFRLRAMTDEEVLRTASWDTIDAYGRRRHAGRPSDLVAGRPAATVSWNEPRDRYARLWRHELGIGVDGAVPDLVAVFEDTGVAEVVVARLATDEPVCAVVTATGPAMIVPDDPPYALGGTGGPSDDVSFLFVNAQRPVTLQRHALAHAFAHLALGHGDVVDRRIEWSRAAPPETEANDFAEEFLAPAAAVARWYDRQGDPRPSVDVLLDLAAAFGVTFWAALYRTRACGRLAEKPQARLTQELRARQWELLPEQSLRGGLRDTLSTLSEEAPLPPPGAVGVGGVRPRRTRDASAAADLSPAILHVPSRLRVWTLQALRGGLLSLEQAAGVLHLPPAALAAELERLGLE